MAEDFIIIEGVTQDGKPFRPSDWAERMSGALSTFRDRKMIYSPLLRPAICNGNRCLLMDKRLEEANPDLYKQMLHFAAINGLKVRENGFV